MAKFQGIQTFLPKYRATKLAKLNVTKNGDLITAANKWKPGILQVRVWDLEFRNVIEPGISC